MTYVTDADCVGTAAVKQDILYIGQFCTILGSITYLYIILLTVLTEIGCGGTVYAVTQICGCGREVQTVLSQFLAVKHNLIFRLVVVTAYVSLTYAGHILHGGQEIGGHLIGLTKVITVNLKLGA